MDVMVLPAYQRSGIASTIVRDIQSGVLSVDYRVIEVFIDEGNTASVRLFEKMGFKFASKEDELLKYIFGAK